MPRKRRERHYGPLPLCVCGCGRPVKRLVVWRHQEYQPVRFYDKDCYSASGHRGDVARAANPRSAYRRRRQRFARYVDRILEMRRRGEALTLGELVGMFQEIATDHHHRGWHQAMQGRPLHTGRAA